MENTFYTKANEQAMTCELGKIIQKNDDWYDNGNQKATVSSVVYLKNCRSPNGAGGTQIQSRQQRKRFFVRHVPDKLKYLPKDAVELWSIYMISFC